MKTQLNKFRIGSALDEGQPLPAVLQRRIDCSPELRSWTQANLNLDQRLRQSVPMPDPPETLQADIMRAVRRASSRPRVPSSRARFAWLPIPAMALGVLILIGWGLLRQADAPPVTDTSSLDSASTAIEVGSLAAQSAPGVLLSPMTDELERLSRDLDSTAKFLLANLP